MRVFLGSVLVVVPILFLMLGIFLQPVGGGGPASGAFLLVALAVFAMPVLLGVYLLAGGLNLSKSAHIRFGLTIAISGGIAAGTALASPSEFDVEVVWNYLLIFGGVILCVLGFGYFRANR